MQFTFEPRAAKRLARRLEKFLKSKGMEVSLGQAIDAIADLQGFENWDTLSAALSTEALDAELDEFERKHLEDAKHLTYGNEVALRAHTGFELRYAADTAVCDYVRTVDPLGREIAYWTADEWEEDPEVVMGAILGSLVRGRPIELFPAKRNPEPATPKTDESPIQADLTIYVESSAADDFSGHLPGWCRFTLTPALYQHLLKRRALVQENGLYSASEWADPDVWEGEGEMQPYPADMPLVMEGGELFVSAHDFWYEARPKHSDTVVTTRAISFDALAQAVSGDQDADTPDYSRRGSTILMSCNWESLARELLVAGEPVEEFASAQGSISKGK